MIDDLQKLPADFDPVEFNQLPGFETDRLSECWEPFRRSCTRLAKDNPVLRAGAPAPVRLQEVAEAALRLSAPTELEARAFFSTYFQPFLIRPRAGRNPHDHGFVTGYYEPEIRASIEQSPEFAEPVLGRPPDLDSGSLYIGGVLYSAGRRGAAGDLQPYWSRAEIDRGLSPAPVILWVRDAIELFMMQVQGSGRATLQDGRSVRLVYDGRNGHPYESIGRILVNEGYMPLEAMSLDSLKNWVRKAGQELGAAGRALLHRNPSYVFFRIEENFRAEDGPIGGEGTPLTKLRSLAVDRAIWSYGLPFWLSGNLPWRTGHLEGFQRMMIAQDTGSAIVGAARGDIFFGSGDGAGQSAARIRHKIDAFVLAPK